MTHSPSDASSSQLKSPGLSVWPSRTTMFIEGESGSRPDAASRSASSLEFAIVFMPQTTKCCSVFRHDLAWAQAKRFCDLSRLGQHHAGLARDGNKLKTLGQAPLSGIGVQNVNAWSDAMFLGGLEDVLDGVGEHFVIAVEHGLFAHRIVEIIRPDENH